MFDPSKHLITLQGKDYLPVAFRVMWFRDEHPDYGIQTSAIVLDTERGIAVFEARVTDETGRVLSTGTKSETLKGFSDFIEKAETGAIGRALGMLGYGTQFAPELDEGERIVDSPQRPSGQPQPAPGNCSTCHVAIGPGLVASSVKAYGRPLCAEHMKAAYEAKQYATTTPAN
jgi:hypothetical protein